MPKKQKKTLSQKQFEITPEFIAGIIADIATSPIDENDKAVFLYAIAKGTFNLELYELYIKKLEETRRAMERRADELQLEIKMLEDHTQKLSVELSKTAVKGLKEWEAGVDHFEQKTMQTIEKTAKSAEQKKISTIQ